MSKLKSAFVLSFVLCSVSAAQASGNQCSDLFRGRMGKIDVNAPGEPDGGNLVRKDAAIIAKLAYELGLEVPAHQLNIVPSGQLDTLAGTGGHPAPHWYDGADVVRNASKASGILEFVTKGCPTCRAFYSASTPHSEQRSVIMHVAGHNDMSSTSKYQTMRPGDAPLASYHLAETLGKAYAQNNHDQVALYYQYLKTFDQLQDFTNGIFEDPKTFSSSNLSVEKPSEARAFWDALPSTAGGLFENLMPSSKPRGVETRGGWNETYSVLQAMTEMLPPDTTEWQRSLFKLNEQSQRAYPSVFQTKIENEGWATLMQYLLARHLPWTESADLVKFAQLMSGVVRPSFENPYWLGLSGWMNLYEQFMQRPDVQGKPEKEKDRLFIKWAREMYRDKNDSAWAKIAFDQRWIEKNRFFLYRKTTREEFDPNGDPEQQMYIALSRDWKRIRNFIISKFVDVKYRQIPSIKVLNPNHTQGFISLVQDKALNLPLEVSTAAKTLFVIAQVMQKPATIDALFESNVFVGTQFSSAESAEAASALATRPDGVVPGKLTVSVRGEVTFQLGDRMFPEIAAELREIVDAYKVNVLGSFHGGLADYHMKQWTQLASKVSDEAALPVNQIVEYAPHTGPAVREYLHVVEQRIRQSIKDSISGKIPGKLTASGITLPVLPEVPTFHYGRQTIEQRIAMKPVGPVDYPGRVIDHDFYVDENGTGIAQGPKLPGDKWSPKKDEQDGNGKGEGEDGEGQGKGKPKKPGEGDEEGEEPSPGQGGGAGNPTDIKIPLKLYGELLGEVIDLPNIRRTIGKIPEVQTIRRGSVRKTSGNVLWDETMIVAIEKARALRRARGLPYDATVPMQELIAEALPMIEPGDMRVSGRMEKPLPDFDAVVVVNIDVTGSMSGKRIEMAKQFVYNLEALLLNKYKNVKIVWVLFDSVAREVTRDKVFTQFFGGGTAYSSAAELDKEILNSDRFPTSRYSKYILTFGDAETSDVDAKKYTSTIGELTEQLQYAGLVVTNESETAMQQSLVTELQKLQGNWPWVGLAHLRDQSGMLPAMQEIFKGDGSK